MQLTENTSGSGGKRSLGEECQLDLDHLIPPTAGRLMRGLLTEISLVLGLEAQSQQKLDGDLQTRVDHFYRFAHNRDALNRLKSEFGCLIDESIDDPSGQGCRGENRERPLETLSTALTELLQEKILQADSLVGVRQIFEKAAEISWQKTMLMCSPELREPWDTDEQAALNAALLDGGAELYSKDERRFRRIITLIDQALQPSEYRLKSLK